MVSAACPRCSILLVETNSALMDDLGAGVDTAVGQGAKIVSNSYYAPEWSGESAEEVHYRHPGVALTASSGDRGYPSYPATSAWVTAVGGTSLTRTGGTFSESAWKYAGHGCSAQIKRPVWQTVPCKSRSGVDVAAAAGLERLRARVAAAEDPRERERLQHSLDAAVVIDPPEDRSVVAFGATVVVADSSRKQQTYTIVGEEEADVKAGKIGETSPLAVALIGAHAGDHVVWHRPAG